MRLMFEKTVGNYRAGKIYEVPDQEGITHIKSGAAKWLAPTVNYVEAAALSGAQLKHASANRENRG